MKRLLNTLYITSGNRYLSLDGENVVVMEDKKEIGDRDLWLYRSESGINGGVRAKKH